MNNKDEKKGWKEYRVKVRFRVIKMILGKVGLATLKIRRQEMMKGKERGKKNPAQRPRHAGGGSRQDRAVLRAASATPGPPRDGGGQPAFAAGSGCRVRRVSRGARHPGWIPPAGFPGCSRHRRESGRVPGGARHRTGAGGAHPGVRRHPAGLARRGCAASIPAPAVRTTARGGVAWPSVRDRHAAKSVSAAGVSP